MAGSVRRNVALRDVEALEQRHDPQRALFDAAAAQSGELFEDPVEHHAAMNVSGGWWSAMKSFDRMFSPPPRKSVTGGLPFAVEARRTGDRRPRRAA